LLEGGWNLKLMQSWVGKRFRKKGSKTDGLFAVAYEIKLAVGLQ